VPLLTEFKGWRGTDNRHRAKRANRLSIAVAIAVPTGRQHHTQRR
jgi:hypothetical protein